jgi:hypothetical protein
MNAATLHVLAAIWDWVSTHGLEIVAIGASPLFALRVSSELDRRRDERNRKMYALTILMATRHSPFADERIRVLNTIDILFYDDEKVREARRNLMIALGKSDGLKPDGSPSEELAAEWNARQWDLVSVMATALKVNVTEADFKLGYLPKALNDMMAQQYLGLEMNRSLIMFARNSLGLPWQPKALFKYPPGDGIIGQYHEPPPTDPPPS